MRNIITTTFVSPMLYHTSGLSNSLTSSFFADNPGGDFTIQFRRAPCIFLAHEQEYEPSRFLCASFSPIVPQFSIPIPLPILTSPTSFLPFSPSFPPFHFLRRFIYSNLSAVASNAAQTSSQFFNETAGLYFFASVKNSKA